MIGKICTSACDDPLLLGNPRHADFVGLGRDFAERQQDFAAVRNPYYHRIDKDGQQLPYIDRLVLIPQSKSPILPAVVDGKSNIQAAGLSLSDLPALKAAANKGIIKLDLRPERAGTMYATRPLPQSQCQGSRLAQLSSRPALPPRALPGCRPDGDRTEPSTAICPSPEPIRCWRSASSSTPTRRRPEGDSVLARAASYSTSIRLKMDRMCSLQTSAQRPAAFLAQWIIKEPTLPRSRCCG